MKLKEMLKEYADVCWYNQPNQQRFCFNTEVERNLFLARLWELNAEFVLYGDGGSQLFKVDVML